MTLFAKNLQPRAYSYTTFKFLVDGGWGEWKEVKKCSKTCGTDVFRDMHRKCDSPPPSNDGKPCNGSNYTFEDCNLKPCPGRYHLS